MTAQNRFEMLVNLIKQQYYFTEQQGNCFENDANFSAIISLKVNLKLIKDDKRRVKKYLGRNHSHIFFSICYLLQLSLDFLIPVI